MKTNNVSAVMQLSSGGLPPDRQKFFESVFEQHYDSLCRFIGRLDVHQDERSDIAQEVYLRIVRQNQPDKLQDNPTAYLFTIATNIVRDSIRKSQRTFQDRHQSWQDDKIVDLSASPEQQVASSEKLKMLKNLILGLPEKKRQILVLNRFHNRTCQQIAEQLRLPLRSVERYLSEAVHYCRVKMRSHDE